MTIAGEAAVNEPLDPAAMLRQEAIGLLAAATASELDRALEAALGDTRIGHLRPPETGLVMLRGRIGGDGAPFNVGEATMSRAVVRLEIGELGFGFRLGRDRAAAGQAAILDALWQRADRRIERLVLGPVRSRLARERGRRSAEGAATRVEFLTLARGSE